jgi:hypothetical protein
MNFNLHLEIRRESKEGFETVCEVPQEYCKDGFCDIALYKDSFIAKADNKPPIVWNFKTQSWEIL